LQNKFNKANIFEDQNVDLICLNLPANPIFSPHLRAVRVIGLEVMTIPTIASIDLTLNHMKKN